MDTIVLAVGSRARQGKGIFCDAMSDHCSRVGVSFGLYDFGPTVLEYCVSEGLLPNVARSTLSPDQIKVLIDVGVGKRKENELFWVDRIHRKVKNDRRRIAVLCGVRFLNEIEFVKSLGGYTVQVIRLNSNGSRFVSPDRDPNAEIESGLDSFLWDFRITNVADRPFWLRRQAVALIDYVREGGEN